MFIDKSMSKVSTLVGEFQRESLRIGLEVARSRGSGTGGLLPFQVA